MWKAKAKEKNSATASDALSPRSLTSETDSGTSSFSKKSDVKDRFQLPMRDSSSSTTTSDIPKNTSPISYNKDTINNQKSQIAPLPNIVLNNNDNM